MILLRERHMNKEKRKRCIDLERDTHAQKLGEQIIGWGCREKKEAANIFTNKARSRPKIC